MGHPHLERTKNARKALRLLGYKRGEYRIETEISYNNFGVRAKQYGNTYVYMRKEVPSELLNYFEASGFKIHYKGMHPIFTF